MGTRGGVSSKAIDKAKDYDFGLGLRMQPKESCFVMSHHHNEPSQLSSSLSGGSGGGGGDGGGGPVFYNRNNRVGCLGDIYDVVGSGSTKSLQPFNSSEMAQCLNMRVPFTVAQWQELERQNIICRYLMASVPVPAELLMPIIRTQSNSNASSPHYNVGKGSLELGISSSNSDPEPWRCKRTDGKKWRCSRDVAPDQKYCERHSHKSRPRSRKPVELQSDSSISISMANNTNSYSNWLTQNQNQNQNQNHKSQFRSQPNSNFSIFSSSPAMVSVPSSYEQPRNLEWFLKGETVPVTSSNSNQEWHPVKPENTISDEKLYHYKESQHLDSNSSYAGSRSSSRHSLQTHRLNDNCSLLLSPKSASSLSPRNQKRQAQETRHFLDVWSSAMRDSCSSVGGTQNNDQGCDRKGLSASSLSLSMAGGSEENENGEATSFGSAGLRPPGGGQWMSHGSWTGSTPGGPLAEALCLGISTTTKADSNFNSSHGSSSYGNTSGINNKT